MPDRGKNSLMCIYPSVYIGPGFLLIFPCDFEVKPDSPLMNAQVVPVEDRAADDSSASRTLPHPDESAHMNSTLMALHAAIHVRSQAGHGVDRNYFDSVGTCNNIRSNAYTC